MRSPVVTCALMVAASLAKAQGTLESTRINPKVSRPHVSAPAEFMRTQAVLVSEDFLIDGYHPAAVLRASMKAGAQAWVATHPSPGARQAAAQSSFKSKLLEIGLSPAEAARVRAVPLAHASIWLRDFGPQWLASERGDHAVTALDFDVGTSLPENEVFPVALAQTVKLPARHVGVALEGGNILADGKTCVIGLAREELAAQKATQSLDRLQKSLACQKLVVVVDPPHPHVDMWLKLPAPGVALVNRLDTSTLTLLKKIYGQVPAEFSQLARRLDDIAVQLEAYFDVRRLPMPLPYRGSFRTFANALLVNSRAIIPRFKRYGWNYDDYPDAHLAADYERAVANVYRAVGFEPEFIDADGLIYNGGGFHCAALQVPAIKLSSKQGAR